MNKTDFLNELNEKININKITLNSVNDSLKDIESIKKIKHLIDNLFYTFYKIESDYLYYNNKYRSDITKETEEAYYKKILLMRSEIERMTFDDLFNGIYLIECNEKYTYINHNNLLFHFYKDADITRLTDTESHEEFLIKKFNSKKQFFQDYLKKNNLTIKK